MRTIVISPHPDDETLGVGGTILKRKNEKCKVAWLIVTTSEIKNENRLIIESKKKEESKFKKNINFLKHIN